MPNSPGLTRTIHWLVAIAAALWGVGLLPLPTLEAWNASAITSILAPYLPMAKFYAIWQQADANGIVLLLAAAVSALILILWLIRFIRTEWINFIPDDYRGAEFSAIAGAAWWLFWLVAVWPFLAVAWQRLPVSFDQLKPTLHTIATLGLAEHQALIWTWQLALPGLAVFSLLADWLAQRHWFGAPPRRFMQLFRPFWRGM